MLDLTFSAPAFSVALERAWNVVDVDLLTDPVAVGAALGDRVSSGDLTQAQADLIADIMSDFAPSVKAQNVTFVAGLAAYDPEAGLVVASLSIAFVVEGTDPGSLKPAASSHRAASGQVAVAPSPTHRDERRREVVVGGVAGWRVSRVLSLPVEAGTTQQLYSVQYVLPTPEPGVTMIATATSPAVALREALDPLFDDALGSIEFA